MGISGLLPMIKPALKTISVEDIQGSTLGIDGYSWLYKSITVHAYEIYTNPSSASTVNKYISTCISKCKALLGQGCSLVFVFDGHLHPMKLETAKNRIQSKNKTIIEIEKLLSQGKVQQARALMSRSVKVTKEMVANLVTELKKLEITCIIAPYESDAQLVYLQKSKYIDYIITEDSDLIVFGGEKIIFKMNSSQGELFCRESILRGNNESMKVLIRSIIEIVSLSGCDYFNGLPRIGLITAHKLILKYKNIKNIRDKNITSNLNLNNYIDDLNKVIVTFLLHVVKDPITKERRYLNEFKEVLSILDKEDLDNIKDISFVGSIQEPEEESIVDREYILHSKYTPSLNLNTIN
ncbi:exonuclease 1 [Nematocida sp. AWRm80]|nr:exonuclease 1 [Nematocida sp. AWRm80]